MINTFINNINPVVSRVINFVSGLFKNYPVGIAIISMLLFLYVAKLFLYLFKEV